MPVQKKISVIIPVYNGGCYLSEAIESVLVQTCQPSQVIVIDDGSTDNSRDVAMRFKERIDYIYQPHGGAGDARNRGIKAAEGEFLAFLDADDIWMPDKLIRQRKLFEVSPELDMVFGHVKQFYSPELESSLRSKFTFAAEVMPGYSCGTMLIRQGSFLRVGFFDPDRAMGEFIEWYLKSLDVGLKSAMLQDVVLKRRLHGSNMGVRLQDQRSEYVRIVKASLDRRRKKELV